jgi:hypothetical protein
MDAAIKLDKHPGQFDANAQEILQAHDGMVKENLYIVSSLFNDIRNLRDTWLPSMFSARTDHSERDSSPDSTDEEDEYLPVDEGADEKEQAARIESWRNEVAKSVPDGAQVRKLCHSLRSQSYRV